MDSFAKARSLNQGILLLVVSCVGILGFMAQISDGSIPLAVMFGVVTPLGFGLGIWLIRRTFVCHDSGSPHSSTSLQENEIKTPLK